MLTLHPLCICWVKRHRSTYPRSEHVSHRWPITCRVPRQYFCGEDGSQQQVHNELRHCESCSLNFTLEIRINIALLDVKELSIYLNFVGWYPSLSRLMVKWYNYERLMVQARHKYTRVKFKLLRTCRLKVMLGSAVKNVVAVDERSGSIYSSIGIGTLGIGWEKLGNFVLGMK